MATMTATNQQYYSSYPAVAQSVNLANSSVANSNYHQQQSYNHHHNHHNQHQQLHQQQMPVAGYQHHQHVAVPNHQSLTQLGQSQRTVSASTNSSTAPTLYSIEATKSTKGASKLRRDLINTEIAQLRELLPLPASTRQRLSQLQLMALVLVYVRKSNYFCNAFRNYGIAREPSLTIPASGFSKALNGFLMMLTQKGKLLYISDNAAEYLGHSMEDLLSHGDEVYDIIEDQDKKIIRTELLSNDDDSQSSPSTKSLQQPDLPSTETRIALCRMNVSRNARRQMRFGDQKVVLMEGHYFGFLPLSSRNEPVFLATCTPIAMPETRECVVQGSTNVFTSVHSMDMKFLHIDSIGEHHLGYTNQQIQGLSWYELVHFDHLQEAQLKHKRVTSSDQERSTIALLRLMNSDQTNCIWVHTVMQVKEATDSPTQPKPIIVCTNQVLSEREAQVMRINSWLYQFYSLHSKMHCNFTTSSSPSAVNQTATPNSVCSDSEDRVDIKSSSVGAALTTSINTSSMASGGAELTKSPPAANLISGLRNQGEASPTRSETFNAQDNYNSTTGGGVGNNGSGLAYTSYQPIQAAAATTLKSSSTQRKLSPLTHSPSSSSTISSSPLSSSSYAQQSNGHRYHQLTSAGLTSSLINTNHGTMEIGSHHHLSQNHHNQHHHHNNSLGSSSASSTTSSSSSSSSNSSQNEISTTPNAPQTANLTSRSVAQSMAAVAAAGNTTAASLYAGIDAIDPLQHMHHHSHHHHPMYSAATAATSQHHTSHHHAAAAVNYANQVMAAQRVAQQQSHHHHHHPYHPYHHHHQHHPAAVHSHQPNHVAPHHHNHHTTPHALYAASSQHHAAAAAASTAVLNTAFNHHHAAAYHSAAAVAAVGAGAHPAHHHPASTIQNPYHSAGAAAAAAAAAHQGVPFHYNKITAAVNASA